MMPNSQKLIIDFGFYHICQIFVKLFAKNMKGGSDQSPKNDFSDGGEYINAQMSNF